MKKAAKIWLWFALVLCVCTTALNLSEGRWLSVAIAAVSIAGLCILLFTQRKAGYLIMCACAVGSFLVISATAAGTIATSLWSTPPVMVRSTT